MKKILTLCMACVLFLGITTTANATTILYDVNNLGVSTWEYNYTVENDSLAVDIEVFTVWFDFDLYDNLAVTSPLIDWDEFTFDPALILGFPDPGSYDAIVSVSGIAGIAPGASATGFSVSFDWLGTGTPGSQPFDIVDPDTFGVLVSGVTSPIPEPSTVLLMGIGLVGLAFISIKFKRQNLTSSSYVENKQCTGISGFRF